MRSVYPLVPGAGAPYNRRMSAPESVREELRASLAAQRELGSDFDPAVAEAFLDRLSRQIDARVDERVAQVKPQARVERPRRGMDFWTAVLALGSIAMGLGAPSAMSDLPAGVTAMLTIVIWVGIVAINVSHAMSRRR